MSQGETDLNLMLAGLVVSRRPGSFAYVHLPARPSPLPAVAALVEEVEGTTIVVEVDVARTAGWPIEFEAAWLTLEVHSALDAVGLTAAVATALTRAGIPCNVLAGTFHDHVLVPVADATRALSSLDELSRSHAVTSKESRES